MKVRAIHRGHVKALLADKARHGLGKNSVRLIRATLSVMLGDAVEDGLIQVNPAAGVGRRGRRRDGAITTAERQKRIRPLSLPHLAALLAHTTGRDRVLYLVMAEAGLRPGEALALQWQDVDLAARTLAVERAVSGADVKTTKTGESRTVDLSQRLATAVGDLQAKAEADALAEDRDVVPWIFPSVAGTPLDAAKVAKRFRATLVCPGSKRC